jgi:3-oxoadipate enol-lactonase
MKLAFEDIGSGKPFVLIHAFPLSKAMWKRQAELLAGNGFRVILPDLPGFGESGSLDSSLSIEKMATEIGGLLESLNIEKAFIGGLSMGGYVVLNLFRRFPEKFSAVILCDTTYLADTEEKRNSRFELISKIEKQGPQALVENMLPNIVSEDTKQNNPELFDELKNVFSRVNPVAAINALRGIAERKDSSDIIGQISVPTLLIFGEHDKITDLENAQKMNRSISDSELVIIENAGHLSNLEQPERFNRALLNFCQRF